MRDAAEAQLQTPDQEKKQKQRLVSIGMVFDSFAFYEPRIPSRASCLVRLCMRRDSGWFVCTARAFFPAVEPIG